VRGCMCIRECVFEERVICVCVCLCVCVGVLRQSEMGHEVCAMPNMTGIQIFTSQ
jgi:hypothetical protein